MLRIKNKFWINVYHFLRTRVFDIKCGYHSGFPLCCILFYITFWEAECFYSEIKRRHSKLGEWYNKKIKGIQYVRCPLCTLRRKKIEIKLCSCGKSANPWQYDYGISFDGDYE